LPWKSWQSFETQSVFCWHATPKAPAPPASDAPLLLPPASSSPPELDPPLPELPPEPPELLLVPLLVPPLDEPEPEPELEDPSCPPLPRELPPEPDEEDVEWRATLGSPMPGSGALHPADETPSNETRTTTEAARMVRAIAPVAPRARRTRRLEEFTTPLRAGPARAPLSHPCDAYILSS
jgi:hypothetical protein